jgi:hypothetical protein
VCCSVLASVFSVQGVHSASWVQLRSYLKEKVAAPVYKAEITAVRIRRTDHATPLYPQKLALTSPTSGGRSVDIVRSRTQATEFFLFFFSSVHRAHSELICSGSRSQSPRGLRPLKQWDSAQCVRIPLEALISVCVFVLCLCCPVGSSCLAAGWSPVQGVLPTVRRILKAKKKGLRPNKTALQPLLPLRRRLLLRYPCILALLHDHHHHHHHHLVPLLLIQLNEKFCTQWVYPVVHHWLEL